MYVFVTSVFLKVGVPIIPGSPVYFVTDGLVAGTVVFCEKFFVDNFAGGVAGVAMFHTGHSAKKTKHNAKTPM